MAWRLVLFGAGVSKSGHWVRECVKLLGVWVYVIGY